MAEKHKKAALYSKETTVACEVALGLLHEAFCGKLAMEKRSVIFD